MYVFFLNVLKEFKYLILCGRILEERFEFGFLLILNFLPLKEFSSFCAFRNFLLQVILKKLYEKLYPQALSSSHFFFSQFKLHYLQNRRRLQEEIEAKIHQAQQIK